MRGKSLESNEMEIELLVADWPFGAENRTNIFLFFFLFALKI